MALWQGSSINSNETAKVFNQLYNRKSLAMVVKLNAMLYAMYGKDDKVNPGGFGVGKSSKITGKKIEVGLMGKLPSPAGITDGAAEYATAAVNYDSAIFGAAEFSLAHYGLTQAVPESEALRFKGEEAKTADYIGDIHDYLIRGYENVFGTALHLNDTTNGVPTRSVFASWIAAVDDANTYGTLDRSDAANADFRGIVSASFGDTTLGKLQLLINQASTNMGKTNLGVEGTTLFTKIQQLVQPYSIATYSQDTAMFGSGHVTFAGVKHILDQRAPTGVIGLLDTNWWELIQNDEPFTSTGLVYDFTKVASYIINTRVWLQNLCVKPNAQVKITGAT